MKVTCDGLSLSVAVNNVSKAISSKTTNPILEGIKIVASRDSLLLTATDLEIAIQEKIPAEVLIEGEVVVPGKYFSDFIRKLNNEQIELIQGTNNSLKIKYNDSEGTLSTLKVDEFPNFERINFGESFSLIQKDFKDIINKTIFCAATEDTRAILKGILFEIEEYSATVVALDGYRLALYKKDIESATNKMSLIIPSRTLSEISKILDDDEKPITVFVENNKIMIDVGNLTIISRLLDGEFINSKGIIPKSFETKVIFSKNQLEEAIDRANVLSRGLKNNLVTFKIKEKTAELVSVSEIGNINEKLNITLEGKDIIISFNPKYIIDALKVLEDQFVSLSLNTNTAPTIFSPTSNEDVLYMVLPIRTA